MNERCIILELGIGDGQFLIDRATSNTNCFFIGIEKNNDFLTNNNLFKYSNILTIRDDFEIILNAFPNYFFDKIYFILPDFIYIDKSYQLNWIKFYLILKSKLKIKGTLILVTEIIDPLLNPITDKDYNNWIEWLIMTFERLNFSVRYIKGVPNDYRSLCINRFSEDKERIVMVTLEMTRI